MTPTGQPSPRDTTEGAAGFIHPPSATPRLAAANADPISDTNTTTDTTITQMTATATVTTASTATATATTATPGTASGRIPQLLMCPPAFYGIEYEINPWMNRSQNADRPLAQQQWHELRHLFESLGAQIHLLEPIAGLPDMVFTANAGLMFHQIFCPAHFRHAERQGESPHFSRWFETAGYQVHRLPNSVAFEGAGDALFCGPILFAAYIQRSEIRAHSDLADWLRCQVLSLELVDPRFYHLDTCFCPLDPQTAIYYPGAFDSYGQQVLQTNVPNLIAVIESEAVQFACNAVVLGRHVIHNSACPQLQQDLRQHGFEPHAVNLSEFLKSGGSAKCLTLRLDGEEATSWARN